MLQDRMGSSLSFSTYEGCVRGGVLLQHTCDTAELLERRYRLVALNRGLRVSQQYSYSKLPNLYR